MGREFLGEFLDEFLDVLGSKISYNKSGDFWKQICYNR